MIPEEVPVALVYDGLTFSIMLASPADLEDFATGFSLTERIADTPGDILGIEVRVRQQGIDLHVRLSDPCRTRLLLRQGRRNLAGRSGCGVCGIDSAEALFEPLPRVAPHPVWPTLAAAGMAVQGFEAAQPLRQATRTTHAAALCDSAGTLLLVREDVGRHNALDKLLGARARSVSAEGEGAFVLISSRCSYEMVDKAARRGVTALVSLSAPTAFAVRRASEAGLALAVWGDDGLSCLV